MISLLIFTHFYSLISSSLCLTSKSDSISFLQIFTEREYVTFYTYLHYHYFRLISKIHHTDTSHITQIFAKTKHWIIILFLISNITTILGKSMSRDEASAKAKRRMMSRDVLVNIVVGIMLLHVFFSLYCSSEDNTYFTYSFLVEICWNVIELSLRESGARSATL